jgi:hypothetical protein
LPRARPEPRAPPKEPKAAGALLLLAGAEDAAAGSAGAFAEAGKSAGAGVGAPDFSGSDMCVCVYEGWLAGCPCREASEGIGSDRVW